MTQKIVLSLVVTAVLLASSLMAALIPRVSAFDPGGPPVGGAAPSVVTGNWEMVNYGPSGGSYSPQNQINKDNAQYLETKWIYPYARPTSSKFATGYGSGAAPIILDGVVYISMNDKRILAIDAKTGKLIWNNTYSLSLDITALAAKYPWVGAPGAHTHAMSYYRDKGWLIQSASGCLLYAVDAKSGKTAWVLNEEQLCGTNAEFGDPSQRIVGTLGNQGRMSGQAHPPVFLANIMFVPMAGGSGNGGRSFVTALDMTDPQNPKRLYREFTQPPAQGDPNWDIDLCKKVNGNGWYFEYPRYLEGINYPARDKDPTYLATKCTDVDPEVVKNDGIDMVPGSKTFGRMHTATNFGSAVWGHYPLDPETGIVYMGWGDLGPYTNATNRYGPNVPGSGFTAFDVKTGKMVWWFAANPHDLWDYDCSWGGILGQAAGQKIFMKGCKNGIVYGLDAATGKPIWIYDAPTTLRGGNNIKTNYGVGANNKPTDPDACCRMTKADMSKPWMSYPDPKPIVQNCYTVCLESDFAYDGKRVYVATYNNMGTAAFGPVRDFGNNGVGGTPMTNFPGQTWVINTNIDAIDVNTGKRIWTFRIDGVGYRGGLSVTGGMVITYASDGNLRFINAETGKLVAERSFGVPVNVMATVGATKDGKMRIFAHVGGGGGILFANGLLVDGTLVAFGLPDVLPQPQVITKEVIKEVPKEVVKEVIKEVTKEVIKEVIKEVPKEVIKEVIKEVPKEVIKEVTVETISPVSYAAIGIGVVLVVISGVLFSRRKKA